MEIFNFSSENRIQINELDTLSYELAQTLK